MDLLWIISATVFVLQTGLHAEDPENLKRPLEPFCPKGWYAFGDLCYKGFQDKLNFDDAEKKCVELEGHLAAISSLAVQEYVTAEILLQLQHRAYIGLRYNESISTMHWTDGSELDFHHWDANEPSRKTLSEKVEHCVEMTFDNVLKRLGKWNDIACDQNLPYICQKAKGFEGEEPDRDPVYCSWSVHGIHFRKSCFHFSSHLKSWEDAENYCVEQYSGHLASVTDVAVQFFLNYSMVTRATSQDRMWIGIRLQPDKVALWSSGWYMGYMNWVDKSAYQSVSPNSCGAMVKGSGLWEVKSCKVPLPFICENSSAVPPPRLNSTTHGLICPPGEKEWRDLGGDFCYIVDATTYVSWYRANFICMTKGGTLASIHSESEMQVLEQFVRFSQNAVHIGLFRLASSQANFEFQWADHSKVDYTKWRYGEPNSIDEMCGEVMPFLEMRWNDKNCDNAGGFICSVFKVPSNTTTITTTTTTTTTTTQKTVEDNKQEKKDECECLPTPAIAGVVLCVLLVIGLVGVVLYNVKPWRKARLEHKERKSSTQNDKPRYRTGEVVISEQIYENVEGVY